MSLRNMLLSIPFKENFFISAAPGALMFGKVCFKEGTIQHILNNTVTINYAQVPHLLDLLKCLGRNIVLQEPVDEESQNTFEENLGEKQLEYEYGKRLLVKENCIIRSGDDKDIQNFAITFEHFTYIQFLTGIANVVLFIVNPSISQYQAIQRFELSQLNNQSERVIEAAKNNNLTEDEEMMLQQFLLCHIRLITFWIEIKKMAFV